MIMSCDSLQSRAGAGAGAGRNGGAVAARALLPARAPRATLPARRRFNVSNVSASPQARARLPQVRACLLATLEDALLYLRKKARTPDIP